ncbi:MAG: hypothetical protein JXJ04_13865 [Spirochaetales bacterium]|nr:hypothetical protein [Spirochaetales bacterium]
MRMIDKEKIQTGRQRITPAVCLFAGLRKCTRTLPNNRIVPADTLRITK